MLSEATPGRAHGLSARCVGRCATMPVGAPLVTPGAGTAQGVCGVSCGGSRCVSVQSRRCVGHPGDTSVAPTLRGVHPRHCRGTPGRAHGLSAALRGPMRDDVRRGATCDARCRNGTRCPRRFVRGECGVASANRGIASAIRATQVSPLRCGVFIHGVAAGHPGGTRGVPSLQRLWRPRCQPTCRNGQPDRFSCRSDSFSGQPSRFSCHGVSECARFNGFWGR